VGVIHHSDGRMKPVRCVSYWKRYCGLEVARDTALRELKALAPNLIEALMLGEVHAIGLSSANSKK
jgi:hypothetical protein